jgi:integrase
MAIKCIRNHGKKVWVARIAYHGKRRARFCENREQAKAAEAELLQELTQETEQEAQVNAAPATLQMLCDAYALNLEARGKAPESVTRAKETQKRLADFLGVRMRDPLDGLTGADLYAFRTWRLQHQMKPATVNRDLRTIRAMLRQVDPTFRFPAGIFLAEDETRVRWLKPEDELVIFATMPAPFGDMARLAAITMMRLTEIRTLRREMVDLGQGVVTLPRTKTTPRQVVLSAEARGILAKAIEGTAGAWLFPGPDGGPYSRSQVSRVWHAAAQAAGLADFHFHDLRHHGATMALNAGFSSSIVMSLGGWKSERMMRRYAAVTDRTLRAAAEAVSGSSQWQQTPNAALLLHSPRP